MKFEFFVGDRVRATRTRKTDAAGDSTTATISGLQLGRAYVARARWKNNVSATGDWSVRSVLVLEEEQPGQGSIARDLLATPGLVSSGNQATNLPRDGSTHWSSRKLAAELGDVSFSAVQRIWRKHGLRPHRLETHMVSNDPDFEAKIENWFARIQRDVIARGVFTSVKDLDKKLMRYIRQYNKDPKPLKWIYADPTRRVTSDSSDSVD